MHRRSKSAPNWPAKAARVGGLLPIERFHPAAVARLDRSRKSEGWAVAFSGGADSLALLMLLWTHRPERRARLVALHFNHRLRGRAADTDEKFCATVCAALGVRFVAARWHAVRPRVSEAGARTARFAFFEREMNRRKIRVLLLAHQQDDIAETLFMRLARGSGTAGLAAPRPVQVHPGGRLHLRPLLTFKKAELVAALRKAGASWREDATNETDDFFRNRVRRSVLPAWVRASGRDALAGAALARERLEEDDGALEAWLDRLAPVRRRGLDLSRLAGVPRAVWRRALHRWLLAVRPETDLSRQGFESLLAAVQRGRDTRFSLGAKGFAVVRGGKLTFKKE